MVATRSYENPVAAESRGVRPVWLGLTETPRKASDTKRIRTVQMRKDDVNEFAQPRRGEVQQLLLDQVQDTRDPSLGT